MQLTILALDAALYPSLLAAVLVLLAQPRRLRLLGIFTAGGMAVSLGVGFVIVAVLKSSHTVKSQHAALGFGMDLAIGGVALLVAVALYTRQDERIRARRNAHHPSRDGVEHEPWSQRVLARGSTAIVLLAALLINLPGAAYLIALKDIAAGHHSTAVDVIQIAVFNLIMFLFAEVPLVSLIVAPQQTDAIVNAISGWLSRNSRRIAIVISAFLGVFLVARGIAHS